MSPIKLWKTLPLSKACSQVTSKLRSSLELNWKQCQAFAEASKELWRTQRGEAPSEQPSKIKSSWVISSSVELGMELMCLDSATQSFHMAILACSNLIASFDGSVICQFQRKRTRHTLITTRSSTRRERSESLQDWQCPRKLRKNCHSSKSREWVCSMIWLSKIDAVRTIYWPSWHCQPKDLSRKRSWTIKRSRFTRWCSAWPTLTKNMPRKSKRAAWPALSAFVNETRRFRTNAMPRRRKWRNNSTRKAAKEKAKVQNEESK